jgi:uncharacterized protein YjbJ (UPF0337 family)
MSMDIVQGKWRQLLGSFQQRMGKRRNHDVDRAEGSRNQPIGRMQERSATRAEAPGGEATGPSPTTRRPTSPTRGLLRGSDRLLQSSEVTVLQMRGTVHANDRPLNCSDMSDRPAGQTKGSVLIPTVKFLRSRKVEARALLPAELHNYLERRILVGSWYPEADFVRLLRVLVDMLAGDKQATWEMVGERAADAHFSGPYAPFIKQGARRVLESFGDIWRLQHDTGRWEIAFDGDSADARVYEFPFGSTEYGQLMAGYFRRVLTMTGARSSACSLVHCDASLGHWRLRWSP